MEIIRFLHDNKLASATLTASSEASGFPVERLQHELFLKHWRTTGVATEWAKADMGAPVEVSHFALRYHNLTTAATVRLQAHGSDAWGAPDFDVAVTVDADAVDYGVLFYDLSDVPKTYRWWRWTMADAANADGYLVNGSPFLGSHFSPSANFVFTRPLDRVSPSVVQRSGGGQKFVNRRSKYRAWEYSFEALPTSDLRLFEAMDNEVGGGDLPFFIVEDADDTPETIYYVRSLGSLSVAAESKLWDAWNVTMKVEEEL